MIVRVLIALLLLFCLSSTSIGKSRGKSKATKPSVATVYAAKSFKCPACDALKYEIGSKKGVVYNYSEPSWVRYYPTVVYSDGHETDSGAYLRSLYNK